MSADDQDYDEEIAAEPETCEMNPKTGLPNLDDEEREEGTSKGAMAVPMFFVVPRVITGLIAFGIYYVKKDKYEARLAKQVGMTEGIGYLFLAGVLFSICCELANMIPTIYKGGVMPGNAGNLRANMAIFKVQQPNTPYVVMEQEGYIGKYNRANRAMYHFVENGMATLVSLLLAGVIFGEAVFVLALIYVLARVWYQIAYTTGGYGMGCCKHAIPFMVHTIIVAHTLEMLVLIAGVRMVALQNAPVAVVVA